MIKGIYLAGRSLNQRVKNIDLIANNLANINSTGYKRQVPFSEILTAEGNINIRQITDFREGEKMLTSNPLDLAISGQGYFLLKNEGGSLEATRDGKFSINAEGFVVNEAGQKLMGKDGEISINNIFLSPDQSINVSKNGEISFGKDIIGQINVIKIDEEEVMNRTESSNFKLENENYANAKELDFEIHQGFLEESNVNPLIEMESMISINNEYESAQKMMQYLDESLARAIEIGKV